MTYIKQVCKRIYTNTCLKDINLYNECMGNGAVCRLHLRNDVHVGVVHLDGGSGVIHAHLEGAGGGELGRVDLDDALVHRDLPGLIDQLHAVVVDVANASQGFLGELHVGLGGLGELQLDRVEVLGLVDLHDAAGGSDADDDEARDHEGSGEDSADFYSAVVHVVLLVAHEDDSVHAVVLLLHPLASKR